jgi:hypothetical protein
VAEQEIYFEMLWNCAQCHTQGLLGKSQRHCPTCGAAQDSGQRYFPKPGEEIQAKDHQFVGVDWRCAYCDSPNSAAAAYCTNCGAGQDGSQPVAMVADTVAPTTPAAKPKARNWAWLRWVLGLLALVIIGLVFLFTSSKETTATVTQRSWAREIQIEQMSRVSESAWCDSLPGDAYAVTHSREQRSTRQVADGQTCHDTRVDQGDGTFVKRQECSTRYRNEPVYDQRCRFQVNRWRSVRAVKADGQSAPTPIWPVVGPLNTNFAGASPGALGSEREGARRESYVLTLASDKQTWTCELPEIVWAKYQQGSSAPLKVRLIGGADCASLK